MGAAPVSEKFGSAEQKRHSLGGEQLEPLSIRLLQAAGVLSLLLILVVVNSLLNEGDQSPFNPNPVAAAAERTQEVDGMRFRMTIRSSSESRPPQTVVGTGAYNGETGLAAIDYRFTSPQGAAVEFNAVMDNDAWYFRYPQFAGRMPEGKEWVQMKPLFEQSMDNSMPSESPESALRMISASGGVRFLGRRRVRGVETKAYAADVEMSAAIAKLRADGQDDLADACEQVAAQVVGPMRTKVFIGGDEIVRRTETTMTVLVDGHAVTSTVRFDIFGLGAHPEIQAPPESQVFDLTPVLEEQLDELGHVS